MTTADDDRTRVLPALEPTRRAASPPPPASTPASTTASATEQPARTRRRGRWWRRALVALLVALLVFPFVLVALLWLRADKVDALVEGGRSDGTVYLLVGSDERSGLTREERNALHTGDAAGRRTDTILLLSVPRSGRPALVSVPRDSLVEVPGYGRIRINAAFAYGGPRLLVRTLQRATGVHIDDYVEIGFGGFVGVVGALGHVDLCLDKPLQDAKAHVDLAAGCQSLTPTQALGYVRARYSDPRGDLGRVERQRQFLGALSDRVTSPAVLLNPVRLVDVAAQGGDALRIDRTTYPWDLVRFGVAMRTVSGSGGDRITVPLSSVGNTVSWDEQRAAQLWSALQDGRELPRSLVAAGSS